MDKLEYQRTGRYFAIAAGSLERHAAAELERLGAKVLQEVPRGFWFGADSETLYRILYASRLLQRVLAPLVSFDCHSEKYLYRTAGEAVDWTALFSPDQTFGIQANVSASKISHSLYAGQVLKDAICDQFRAKHGRRPDFLTRGADIGFNLHIRENKATLALDLSGESLHKRGYRKVASSAPLQETLAAALVELSGWAGDRPLLDPMCGSGTILAEALMRHCRIPAGFLRDEGGLRFLPDFDSRLYRQMKTTADAHLIPLPRGLIRGSDISAKNVMIARENLAQLPYGVNVELGVSRFQDLDRAAGLCLITNPPYGVRLGDDDSTPQLYHDLGDFLKRKCPDSEAYILCGNKTLVPELRLRAHWKKNLKNADLEVVLAKIIVKGWKGEA